MYVKGADIWRSIVDGYLFRVVGMPTRASAKRPLVALGVAI